MTNEAPSRKRIGTPDWDKLIPGMRGYLVPGPTWPEEWAFYESNLQIALGFSDLFWPPFIQYDGMVFRGSAENAISAEGAKNIADWMTRFEGKRYEVERMLNHEHLIDLFRERNRDASASQIDYLAKVLHDAWAAKLKLDFPQMTFKVDLELSEPKEIGDWFITFYQQPPE